MPIYVIAHNGGHEGYSPPVQAFHSLAEARAALALADRFELFEVPVWPEIAQAWFCIAPLKLEKL